MGRSDLADIDFFRDQGLAQDPYAYYAGYASRARCGTSRAVTW